MISAVEDRIGSLSDLASVAHANFVSAQLSVAEAKLMAYLCLNGALDNLAVRRPEVQFVLRKYKLYLEIGSLHELRSTSGFVLCEPPYHSD